MSIPLDISCNKTQTIKLLKIIRSLDGADGAAWIKEILDWPLIGERVGHLQNTTQEQGEGWFAIFEAFIMNAIRLALMCG